MTDDFETIAKRLENSGDYRVLRRLKPFVARRAPDAVQTRIGLFVDTETTGLDPARNEIIELAMVPFTYTLDGEILSVGEAFSELRQPSVSIPAEITAVTGITDYMVAGKSIDPAAVARFAAPAALVIAHNAAFDRQFLERFCSVFTTKAWACSMNEVDWAAEGYEGKKLAYLTASAGFFYDRHRAETDCLAGIALLGHPLPATRKAGLAHLLARARMPSWRIWAENSPYDLKDLLRPGTIDGTVKETGPLKLGTSTSPMKRATPRSRSSGRRFTEERLSRSRSA